ncbi:hypothetical protein CPC08DRAFT_704478 [Agrocybe pediades]|nr:hypothetical protein CPC08DRAFT_704478 [Agrocybe pediades]
MKFSLSSVIFPLALAHGAFSQSVRIGAPADQSSVQAGSSIVVEVDRPDTLTPSTEIALVIGVASCHNAPCLGPDLLGLGTVLYSGPFNPQFDTPADGKPPHQNFTVVIPESFQKGPAQLALFHIALVGASVEPLAQLRNITLNIL